MNPVVELKMAKEAQGNICTDTPWRPAGLAPDHRVRADISVKRVTNFQVS